MQLPRFLSKKQPTQGNVVAQPATPPAYGIPVAAVSQPMYTRPVPVKSGVPAASPQLVLWKQVLDIYWGNALALSMIILVPLAAHMLLWEFGPLKNGELQWLGFVLVFTMLTLQSWGIISALDRWSQRRAGIPLSVSYGYRLKQILATAWVIILALIFVTGGLFLFVLPGLYMLLYFSVAIFMPVCRQITGYTALMTSLAYIKGREKEIIPHLVLAVGIVTITLLIPFTVTDFLGITFINSSLWGADLLLVTPLLISYFFLIFQKVMQTNPVTDVYIPPLKNPLVLMGAAGYIIAIFAGVVLLSPNTFRSRQTVSDDQLRERDKQIIDTALRNYYYDIKSYPLTLDTLKPHYLSVVPLDPRYQLPYVYESASDGQDYKLCLRLEAGLSCSGKPQ